MESKNLFAVDKILFVNDAMLRKTMKERVAFDAEDRPASRKLVGSEIV